MTRNSLATALGLSRQQVHRLVKQGMPTDSVEEAMDWRDRNVDMSYRNDYHPEPDEFRLTQRRAANKMADMCERLLSYVDMATLTKDLHAGRLKKIRP